MRRNLSLGLMSVVALVVLLAIQGYVVKALSLPIHKVVLGRFAAAFLLLGLYLLFLHRLSTLARSYVRMKSWWGAIVASILGSVSIGCYFFSLQHLSLSLATTLFLSSPLFLPLVRRFFLKDPLDFRIYWGIGVAVIGFLCIVQAQHWMPVMIGLIAAVAMAIWIVFWQRLHANHTPLNISFHYFGIGALAAFFLGWILQGKAFFVIDPTEYYSLVVLGMIALGCQLFFTLALRYAPARLALSWIYASVLVMIAMDEWLYSATISLTSIIGMILVVMGSIGTMQIVLQGLKKNV